MPEAAVKCAVLTCISASALLVGGALRKPLSVFLCFFALHIGVIIITPINVLAIVLCILCAFYTLAAEYGGNLPLGPSPYELWDRRLAKYRAAAALSVD